MRFFFLHWTRLIDYNKIVKPVLVSKMVYFVTIIKTVLETILETTTGFTILLLTIRFNVLYISKLLTIRFNYS